MRSRIERILTTAGIMKNGRVARQDLETAIRILHADAEDPTPVKLLIESEVGQAFLETEKSVAEKLRRALEKGVQEQNDELINKGIQELNQSILQGRTLEVGGPYWEKADLVLDLANGLEGIANSLKNWASSLSRPRPAAVDLSDSSKWMSEMEKLFPGDPIKSVEPSKKYGEDVLIVTFEGTKGGKHRMAYVTRDLFQKNRKPLTKSIATAGSEREVVELEGEKSLELLDDEGFLSKNGWTFVQGIEF